MKDLQDIRGQQNEIRACVVLFCVLAGYRPLEQLPKIIFGAQLAPLIVSLRFFIGSFLT
jgi:hypothetical protein